MPRGMVMGASLRSAGIVKQAIFEHPVRVVAAATLDVTIARIEQRSVLNQVSVLNAVNLAGSSLVVIGDWHVGQTSGEICFYVGNLKTATSLTV